MRTRNISVEESQMQVEVSKVIEKYKSLGYEIKTTTQRMGVEADLIVEHPITGDSIVFEFKHLNQTTGKTYDYILHQRDRLKEVFPKSKIVVVFVRDIPKPKFDSAVVRILLRDFIRKHHFKEFEDKISGFGELEEVNHLELKNIDLGDFNQIELAGIGNINFRALISTDEFYGTALNEGVPFNFKISLRPFYIADASLTYRIAEAKIDFDFSEFKE